MLYCVVAAVGSIYFFHVNRVISSSVCPGKTVRFTSYEFFMMLIRIVFLLVLFILKSSVALVHDITIVNDGRSMFEIETFGFMAGGFAFYSKTKT